MPGGIACRQTPANYHRLTACGLDVPWLNVGYKFQHIDPEWAYYENQKNTAGFLSVHHRAWCLNGLRSGKTHSCIGAREILREIGFKGRTLILSPENVVNEAWGDSYKAVNPDLNIYISDKTVHDMQVHGMVPETDVLIMNHGKLPYAVEDVDRWDFDFLIVDEGSVYRTWNKEPLNNLTYLARNRYVGPDASDRPDKRWLWNATGTPRPRAATDVYGMCKLINPDLMPYSYNQWRRKVQDKHEVRDKVTRKWQFTIWSDKDKAQLDKVCADAMQPSIRYRTEDCVDLPPQAYSYFHTPCEGDQKTLYNMIGRKLAGRAGGHDYRVAITPNKIGKLLQVASGVVRDVNDEWVTVGAKKRLDTLLELYNAADGKVVVFIEFRETADYIKKELKKHKIKVDVIHGGVSKPRREKIRAEFQKSKRKSVLVMHSDPTKFGTNVSAASVSIWWVPTMKGENWIQANERARAPNSTKTLIAMFYSSALEREYYERVRGKGLDNKKTVDYYGEFRKTRKVDGNLQRQFAVDNDE